MLFPFFPRACLGCKKVKAKCEDVGGDQCRRCQRLGFRCEFLEKDANKKRRAEEEPQKMIPDFAVGAPGGQANFAVSAVPTVATLDSLSTVRRSIDMHPLDHPG